MIAGAVVSSRWKRASSCPAASTREAYERRPGVALGRGTTSAASARPRPLSNWRHTARASASARPGRLAEVAGHQPAGELLGGRHGEPGPLEERGADAGERVLVEPIDGAPQ